ncbi:MAG: hypothetical protein ACYCO9_16360 [Streptosporangiaceae bacterium]
MHEILRAIVGAMKTLDERSRRGLLDMIGEHEKAHAPVLAPVEPAEPNPAGGQPVQTAPGAAVAGA